MSDVTTAAELIDRVAQKITRIRGVAGVVYSEASMDVRLANGTRVTFTIDTDLTGATRAGAVHG